MLKKISKDSKIILMGRVYPAIRSSVQNRYKIILGYFTIIGLVFFDEKNLTKFTDSYASLLVASLFTLFVVHNTINYCVNAKLQWEHEKINGQWPWYEMLSCCIMLFIIWGVYFYINYGFPQQ